MNRRFISMAVRGEKSVFVLSIGLLSLGALSLCAQESKEELPKAAGASAAAEYKKLIGEFQSGQQRYFQAYQAAKTDEERTKLVYPDPGEYANRFMALAKKHSQAPEAVDALIWVVQNSRTGSGADEALSLLAENHLQNAKIGAACQTLVYSPNPSAEKFLRKVIEKNEHRDVQGQALLSLGKFLKTQIEMSAMLNGLPQEQTQMVEQFYGKETMEKLRKQQPGELTREIESTFEKVAEKYGDVSAYGSTLGDQAKAGLFEIRNLAIGKVAPEIEGDDVEGKQFKLSEYRGKVVVLDFWGDW